MNGTADQTGAWITAQTEENGVLVTVRLRPAPPVDDIGSYPHQINIIWDYDGLSDGMPEEKTLANIERFSNALLQLDAELDRSCLVVTLLGDDRAEWIWYTADVDAYMAAFSARLREFEGFPFDMETIEDPKWESYRELRASVK